MQPGLPAFEWWATPPDEVLLRVYVFNVTNQHDYESGRTDKLHVQELGPYIFRCVVSHRVFHTHTHTLTTPVTAAALAVGAQVGWPISDSAGAFRSVVMHFAGMLGWIQGECDGSNASP